MCVTAPKLGENVSQCEIYAEISWSQNNFLSTDALAPQVLLLFDVQ